MRLSDLRTPVVIKRQSGAVVVPGGGKRASWTSLGGRLAKVEFPQGFRLATEGTRGGAATSHTVVRFFFRADPVTQHLLPKMCLMVSMYPDHAFEISTPSMVLDDPMFVSVTAIQNRAPH